MTAARQGFRLLLGSLQGRIAVVSLLAALAVQTGGLGGVDPSVRLQVTHSLWTDEPPIKPGEFGVVGRDGKRHAWYGIGQSLVMLPADVVATKVAARMPIAPRLADKLRVAMVAFLTFPLITTATVLVAFRLLRALAFSPTDAAAGCLGLQLATTFLHYCQVHQENSLLLLGFLAALLGVLRWLALGSRRWLGLAAGALGFDLLVRVTTAIDVLWVGIFAGALALAASGPERRRRASDVLCVAVPVLAGFVLVERAYQWYRFGNVFTTYIHMLGEQARAADPSLPAAYPFNTPFREGFSGPLVDPGKSVFLFDPLLVLTLVLVVSGRERCARAVRMLVAALVAMLLCYIAFYARSVWWSGGCSWANRYTTVPVEALALLALPLARERLAAAPPLAKVAVACLVAWSFVVQVASVLISANIECAQFVAAPQPSGYGIPRRFVNIAALATGRFDAWGLSAPGYLEVPSNRRFTLLPFACAEYLPGRAAAAITVAWLSLVALLVYATVRLGLDLRRGVFDPVSAETSPRETEPASP